MQARRTRRTHVAGGAGVAAAVACLLGAGAGCGKNRVTLDIDVASFVNPAALIGDYQVPAGSPAIEVDNSPIAVDIGPALREFASAEEMDVDVDVRFENSSGQGSARITVFFDDTDTGVFGTPAVTAISAALAPNQTSTGSARFRADARVLDLFRRGQVWMGLRLRWEPSTGDALAGTYTITRIHARVVTRVEVL